MSENIKYTISAVDNFSGVFGRIDKSIKNAEDKLAKFGQAGKVITAGSVALAAGLGATVKVAADFEASMSRVGALSGATDAEMAQLTQTAKDLGANTVFSASEAAEGLSYLAMAGFDVQNSISAMPGLLDLAAAGQLDLGAAADITSNILSGFGIAAEETGRVADVLTKAFTSSNTTMESLGESFKMLAPTANALGVPIEDAAAAVGILGDAGIQGSMAGSQLSMALTRLSGPSTQAAKVMEEIGFNAFNSAGEMKPLEDIIRELTDSTSDLTEEQRMHAISTIFGAQSMKSILTLMDSGADTLGDFAEELRNSGGTAEEIAEKQLDNLSGQITILKSALEGAAISFGHALIPALKRATSYIQRGVDWFNGLSDSTKNVIAATAGVATALGLIGGSAMILIGMLPKIAAGFSLMLGPVGLVTAAVGVGLVGAFALFKKANEDAIPPVERFSDEVSESTQEAVGAYMDMSEKADKALKELAWSQETVTKESAKDMISQQRELSRDLMRAIDERHKKEIEQTQKHIQSMDGLDDKTKKEMLKKTDEYYENERKKVREGEKRVEEILETAAKEKRELTEKEYVEILAIREAGVEQSVKIMSENEMEQKIILEKMVENASTLSALEAAEVVKNSLEKKEAVIADAEEQFDETYAWAIRQRDELGTLTAEQAQEIIDNAREQRDETIAAAAEMHNNVVKHAKEQADEHVNKVDWETGEVLSKWQWLVQETNRLSAKMQDWVVDKSKGLWEGVKKYFGFTDDDVKDAVDNITENVEKGFNKAKDFAIEKIEQARNKIKEIIDDLTGYISEGVDKITGFFSNMKLDIPKPKMPKMPRFSMSGGFSLNPPSVPRINVNWNARGGLFTRPTIFNTPMGLQGFGEAGPEAAIPLTPSVLGMIGASIAEHMPTPTMDYDVPSSDVYDSTTARILNDNSRENLRLLAEIREELRRQRDIIVELEGREVGRIVEPYVTENQVRNKGVNSSFA